MCGVVGGVVLATAPDLADKLGEAVHDGRPHVVIDLSAVTVHDSIGLQAVFAALDSCDIEGHLAVVVDPRSAAVTRPDITALGDVIDIHHDLAGALRACARAPIPTGGRHRAEVTTEPPRIRRIRHITDADAPDSSLWSPCPT
ncbi:MAG: STAS domain-containing protein [Pseudonocardiales bacterium]|nr:STAS domain-containing protein [Pseudonocardiales bacterium]MBV9031424.1 STAS domain-containing protein [Pseudonocardiales bacterium]